MSRLAVKREVKVASPAGNFLFGGIFTLGR